MTTLIIIYVSLGILAFWLTVILAECIVRAAMRGLDRMHKDYEMRPYWPDVRLVCHNDKRHLVGGRWIESGRFINLFLKVQK